MVCVFLCVPLSGLDIKLSVYTGEWMQNNKGVRLQNNNMWFYCFDGAGKERESECSTNTKAQTATAVEWRTVRASDDEIRNIQIKAQHQSKWLRLELDRIVLTDAPFCTGFGIGIPVVILLHVLKSARSYSEISKLLIPLIWCDYILN